MKPGNLYFQGANSRQMSDDEKDKLAFGTNGSEFFDFRLDRISIKRKGHKNGKKVFFNGIGNGRTS